MTVREWVYEREITGHSTFSHAEVALALPSYSRPALSTELNRLSRSGLIVSVHRGFYVTVPTRYKKTGVVPPLYYVDAMFKYLEKPYYLSLLSAAQFFGAAHQKAQIDFVTTVLPRMSNSRAKNPYLTWIYRKQIPEELILERNSEGGIVRYSSPELTMMDLVQYKHFVGGLGMAATIIAELSESIDFSTSALSRVFPVVTGSTVQRAGYILEEVLGEKEKADLLHEIYKDYGARMEWILLEPAAKKPLGRVCNKWKVIVNEEVEVDEL